MYQVSRVYKIISIFMLIWLLRFINLFDSYIFSLQFLLVINYKFVIFSMLHKY